MTFVISIAAIVISIVSLSWSIITHLKKSHSDAMGLNTNLIVEIEGRVSEFPALLRFHGIEQPDKALKQHGVTSAEFAYLVNSFTVAGTFFRTSPFAGDILKKGSYRRAMCEAAATQKAWPLVRVMIADSPYRKALDRVFAEIGRNST